MSEVNNSFSKLITLCKYYKGEPENPYDYSKEYNLITELKSHFWDYEEMFVKKSTNFTSENEFKDYINGCINKCTPNEYDPFEAYFNQRLVLKVQKLNTNELKSYYDINSHNVEIPKEQVEFDILEWSIKKNVKYRDTIIDPFKKEDAQRMIDGQLQRLKDLKQSEPEKIAVSSPKKGFKYDSVMIARVYDFLIDERVYDCDMDEFVLAIKTANFKSIKPLQKSKSKIKILIYKLSTILGDEWYEKASKSISVDKSRCSGIRGYEDWEKDLELAIKPKKTNNPHKF